MRCRARCARTCGTCARRPAGGADLTTLACAGGMRVLYQAVLVVCAVVLAWSAGLAALLHKAIKRDDTKAHVCSMMNGLARGRGKSRLASGFSRSMVLYGLGMA